MKKDGQYEMKHAGNFNYGAMGRAAGLSKIELRAGAGVQQVRDGTSGWSYWNSWGDDPIDQGYINEGIDWYDNYY